MITAPDSALYWAITTMFVCLICGSIARFVALRGAEEKMRRQRLQSLGTWWMIAIFISAGLLLGPLGICLLLTSASCFGWWELTCMYGARKADRLAINAGYVLIVLNYGAVLIGWIAIHTAFLPVAGLLTLAFLLLAKDEPQGYIRSAGCLLWGMMFIGYGVSHGALLMVLPATSTGPIGPAGWFLFVVILTETDDIFQALVGRLFGTHKRHRLIPTISPNKTWEGFIGGMVVIVLLAPVIAPWLTTLDEADGPFDLSGALAPIAGPVLAALLISIAGFFGDINMSAIKRDSGVKDSSSLLPGMGGVLDRIDSLTVTAPVFVYFTIWWTS